MAKKQKIVSVRIDPGVMEEVEKAAKEEGYSSPSSYIREACKSRLGGVSKALEEAEERILELLFQQSQHIHMMQKIAIVQYQAMNIFMKLYLTYTPEIAPEEMEASIARAKTRYRKYQDDVAREIPDRPSAYFDRVIRDFEKLGVKFDFD
ncbi:hypothetical protein [Silvibacterium dinghuense]|uniref:Ribbon-helix-helix protein CopG domain-containing protein n=1 Tax=Silvibacterium dinghuense TaxID=1560006 RepID=A0A4Q1SK02_9BACT|nr:hypothetical protein [Silvibacterium dinghuense]RXS97996.1 hypothetical protein ESZ00_09160 [Silvibacterium dinghuense]GGH03684.1 hypothetical protein GCM10011586_19570 [Silvibacterium dinghuense]